MARGFVPRPGSEFFAPHGKAHFRETEAAALRGVLARPAPPVPATGGGTPCLHHNPAALQAHSPGAWPDVPAAALAARLANGHRTAPAGRTDGN